MRLYMLIVAYVISVCVLVGCNSSYYHTLRVLLFAIFYFIFLLVIVFVYWLLMHATSFRIVNAINNFICNFKLSVNAAHRHLNEAEPSASVAERVDYGLNAGLWKNLNFLKPLLHYYINLQFYENQNLFETSLF